MTRLHSASMSSDSALGGSTEDFDGLRGPLEELSPGFARAGLPTRLRAEREVLAAVAAAYAAGVVISAVWTVIVWGARNTASPWPLIALAVPHALLLAIALGVTYLCLPAARWLRPDELGRPPTRGGWALRVLGVLAVPMHALLEARDRREMLRVAPRTEVEAADRALIGMPRVVATVVFVGLTVGAVSDALIARGPMQWPWMVTLSQMLLWVAIAGPLTVLAAAQAARSLRGEILASPLAQLPLPPRLPAMTVGLRRAAFWLLFAGGGAPLLAAHLWLQAHAQADAHAAARRAAQSVLEAASPLDEAELGRRLAAAPGASVQTARGAVYGPDMLLRPGEEGLVDGDGDGESDRFVAAAGGARVAVPLRPHRETSGGPLLLFAGLVILVLGGAAAWVVARRVERDLAATRALLAESPTAPNRGPEWRALALAIDGLTTRMQEATIARFVALEKAEETDRLRSQFLANMSHDLRSPLNSILGFSSLLLRGVDGELDADTREMVDTIAAAGRDLLHQIDAILDMARIEARRIEKQAEPVPLAPVISRAVQRSRLRAGDHINYAIEAVPGLPPAYVDPRHLVQALENLLLFAGKRLTGGTLHIKLRRGDPDTALALQIHITTPLKPATESQMALARKGFHRLPGHRGLGLELPIADALLKIEGCRLDVREIGQAMVFKIQLPAAETRNPVPVIERAPAVETTPPPAS